jgi:hypothetical protein
MAWVKTASTADLRTSKGVDLEALASLSPGRLAALEIEALRDVAGVARNLARDLEHVTGADAFMLGVTLGRLERISAALGAAADNDGRRS